MKGEWREVVAGGNRKDITLVTGPMSSSMDEEASSILESQKW